MASRIFSCESIARSDRYRCPARSFRPQARARVWRARSDLRARAVAQVRSCRDHQQARAQIGSRPGLVGVQLGVRRGVSSRVILMITVAVPVFSSSRRAAGTLYERGVTPDLIVDRSVAALNGRSSRRVREPATRPRSVPTCGRRQPEERARAQPANRAPRSSSTACDPEMSCGLPRTDPGFAAVRAEPPVVELFWTGA